MEGTDSIYLEKAELLKALSHPVRLRIVRGLLHCGCRNVGCMEANTGQSQSCISQHLMRLKAAGIVKASAVQARVRNKSVLVVGGDDRDNPLYKTPRIENYLGFPQASGQELLDRFHAHAREMGAERKEGRVLNIMPMGDTFYLSIGSEM